MIKLKKTLRKIITSALLAGSTLFPFRGDFTPRYNFNVPKYEQKLVVAHRGGTEHYRENSLEAFSHLKKTGADMAEMDVRSTKDGKLIVYHDRTIAGRPLKWITYNRAEELAKKLGYHIPLFDEALKTLKNKKAIVDLKETGTEKKVMRIIGKYLPDDNVIVSSRNAESLRKIKSINKNVKTSVVMPSGFLNLGTKIRDKLGIIPWRIIKQANADYVSVDGSDVNQSFYDYAGDGVGILVYGLKNKSDIKNILAKKNVIGIISENPTEAVKIRDEK